MFSKNMKSSILIGLCIALAFVEVHADPENEVPRGHYPYMAFIYYPDETVVDSTGNRFIRGAVLIRVDWLVSSAIGPNVLNGFPRKTMLARAGAITIDANFTLNEDEYEQEREVIQIVRPYNHSATQWWRTDISLMKTLLPFNTTSAVGIPTINPKHDYLEKSCIILVYVKRFSNWTEDKILIQIAVDLLPPSINNCGRHFVGNTMTCASDSDDNKHASYDPNFCQGNSGGPLICDNDVTGLQTYIDNNCKQPHLYQLLAAWDNFISCGTEEKCQEEECANICDIANKDAPEMHKGERKSMEATTFNSEYTTPTLTTTTPTTVETVPPTTTQEDTTTIITTIPEALKTEIVLMPSKVSIASGTPNATNENTVITTTDIPKTETEIDTTETWPKEKKLDSAEQEHIERKPTVEAQRHVKAKSGAVSSYMMKFQTISFEFFIMACLI